MSETATERALLGLLDLPGVADSVDAAREACTQLRWHPALRRRTEEARAEALIRAARHSAAIEGARYPVDLIRDVTRGVGDLPDDASGRLARNAVRVLTEARSWESRLADVPAQALARLQVVSAAGLLPPDALGRPRLPGELPGDGIGEPADAPDGAELRTRLDGVLQLLSSPSRTPALLIAALVHAEVITVRPFVAGNGLVARALARAVIVGRGLDPMGVVVWEGAHLDAGPGYGRALVGYGTGRPEAVGGWLKQVADAVVAGAGEGRVICDAIVAGRLT